jgi:hypothetical protein
MGNINQDILKFASKHKGRNVKATGKKKDTDTKDSIIGKGECWDLPYEALNKVGAKTPNTRGGDLYDWGQVITMESATSGDIVQFSNHKATILTIQVITTPKQTITNEKEKYAIRGPIHSAIIDKVNGDGTMDVYEQHVNRSAAVQRNKVYFKSSEKKETAGNITTTTTVTVTGSAIFYRPLPKKTE